jgi:hypothetical protein
MSSIPSWEGQKPKASGWVLAAKVPPRRCATPREDSQAAMKLSCKIRVLTKDLSLLDSFQAKRHHFAAYDKAEVLLPEFPEKPATGQLVFQVDKELDSKPFV